MGFWYDPPITAEERRQDEITRYVRAVFGLTAVFGSEGGSFDVYSALSFDPNLDDADCAGVAIRIWHGEEGEERAFIPFSKLATVQSVEDARAILLASDLPPRLHAAVVG